MMYEAGESDRRQAKLTERKVLQLIGSRPKAAEETPADDGEPAEDVDREAAWWADYHGKDPRPSMEP